MPRHPFAATRWPLLLVLPLLLTAARPAEAKRYVAERFDSRIEVLAGGELQVTETVVFRFESGTFQRVFRDIPQRRTDGIEILSARMDGRPLPFGTGVGEVEIRRRNRLRVRWHFAPVSGSTHSFELTYIARGVVRRDDDADVLAWRALPTQHDYRIETSTVEIALPAALTAEPDVQARRVSDLAVAVAGGTAVMTGRDIGRNGWIEPRLRFAEGSLIAVLPEWQRRQLAAAALAPMWAGWAGIVLIVGVALVMLARRGYPVPPRRDWAQHPMPGLPEQRSPAAAGVLASNGSVQLQHAMAALFDLADRGAVVIAQPPRKSWGTWEFQISRGSASAGLAPHEAVLLDAIFTHRGQPDPVVSLTKARSRVSARISKFSDALLGELRQEGLLDEARVASRQRVLIVSVVLLLAALAAAPLVLLLLVDRFEAWPLLLVGGLALAGFVGIVVHSAMTSLSDEGVRRADAWRASQAHLRAVARKEAHLSTDTPARLLPYAIALSLGPTWSAYLKTHPAAVPEWFRAAAPDVDHTAIFAALVASGGAGSGGGGGAAGGGASGAG